MPIAPERQCIINARIPDDHCRFILPDWRLISSIVLKIWCQLDLDVFALSPPKYKMAMPKSMDHPPDWVDIRLHKCRTLNASTSSPKPTKTSKEIPLSFKKYRS